MIQYIFHLIHINMEYSYFKETSGIFLTTCGFLMGDISASRGIKMILRDSELVGTFEALHAKSLLSEVEDYVGFKDDICTCTLHIMMGD